MLEEEKAPYFYLFLKSDAKRIILYQLYNYTTYSEKDF